MISAEGAALAAINICGQSVVVKLPYNPVVTVTFAA